MPNLFTSSRSLAMVAPLIAATLVLLPSLAAAQAVAPHAPSTIGPPAAPSPSEPRVNLAPGLRSRSPAVRDAKYAVNAMQLTALQEQKLGQIRARYSSSIRSYVARLNALDQRGAAADTIKATQDTLKSILGMERAAADSLISSDQRQRYLKALREVHSTTVVNPADASAHP